MQEPKIKSFQDFFNHSLNKEQQKAVKPKYGTLLVCAGAGSGKTRVITARIAHLILNHEVNPESILALTFTNKAAKEMKERVTQFLSYEILNKNDTQISPSGTLPFVGTFHSYCLRLLKQYGHLVSLTQFSLLDEIDKDKILKTILQKTGLAKKITSRQASSSISRIKNEIAFLNQPSLFDIEPYLNDLYHHYEQEKKKAFCLDFDDLLIYALELFSKNPSFKEKFQKTIRHVLVDEYQDTNTVQHALLKAITLDTSHKFCLDSLCAVGDEDQSIYSWRGATVSNIINFNKDYPDCISITIDQNYRSVQPILHLANSVITHNTYRNPKQLWSNKEGSDRIRILTCASSSQEAYATGQFLKTLSTKKDLNSCAILYRSHYQSRALEEALIRNTIPYKVIGGIQFYERQEIKDLIAYLKLIVNPHDRIAFGRIINTPSRGLGEKFEELFYSLWDEHPLESFKQIGKIIIENSMVTRLKQNALDSFLDLFNNLTPSTLTSLALQAILEKTSYNSFLEKNYEKEEALTKKENIKELLNSITYFENQSSKTVTDFLDEVSLLQELNEAAQDNHNYVKLMTLHAAKGLEFNNVILTGLEEGVLPSARSLYSPDALEEERRLLYVGLTRACERLLITHTRYRYTYGTVTDQRPSRFLEELDKNYSLHDDSSYWKNEQFVYYFNNWLKYSPNSDSATLCHNPSINNNPTNNVSSAPADTIQASKAQWHKNQRVKHPIFGIGIIEKVEKKQNKDIFITARFNKETKKIAAQYLESTY